MEGNSLFYIPNLPILAVLARPSDSGVIGLYGWNGWNPLMVSHARCKFGGHRYRGNGDVFSLPRDLAETTGTKGRFTLWVRTTEV